MTDRIRIALAQLNPTMGDLTGNLAKARAARAAAADADLILFPELYITGYPPEDLILKRAFVDDALAAVQALAADTVSGPSVLIGTPWREDGKLYNAVAHLDGGKIVGRTLKADLPNYGVFDEKRIFSAGRSAGPFDVRGVKIGVPICEDIWTDDTIVGAIVAAGAEILLVPNASPYEADKENVRLNLVKARVAAAGKPMAYLNTVGGQDEVVFDGASIVVNADGSLARLMPPWAENVVTTEWTRTATGWVCTPGEIASPEERSQSVYHAMMLGLRDYVNKNRFPGVVLGLSGGIDSALSAAVAVDALGADRVRCVMLPSRYTSDDSLVDAEECAKLLGVKYETIAIEDAVKAFGTTLASTFAGRAADTTEENIQSRIRGLILMAISNKFGPMVLTTGNKSEMSVGYATLYGDMCGGYNVLKDIYKMEVFRLSHWRNANMPAGAKGPNGRVIPERIIVKPPTAELRANQTDQDSLPPYEILDGILLCLVEQELSFEEVVAKGYDPATVKRVEHLLYLSEYKRRQAPPGVKIGPRNFGRDRRYPITNAFRDAR